MNLVKLAILTFLVVTMLPALSNSNDDKTGQNYSRNSCDVRNESFGFDIGLKEAIAVAQRERVLMAAEPIYDRASADLCSGNTLAALLYADGQKDAAKSLAKELLPLIKGAPTVRPPFIENESKKIDDENEAFLRGILDNNDKVVANYLPVAAYADDSIGRRLEEAYGRIYLYKRLKMDLSRLPYAYKELGWTQALAGNYKESERAYKTALLLALKQYEPSYPEIPLLIRSEYAGMLRVAGKAAEADKLAAGLTPSSYREVELKAHPERATQLLHGPAPNWGKEGY